MIKELETIEALTGLKELISSPAHFTKHALYRDDDGVISYCIVGGIRKLCTGAPTRLLPMSEWSAVENTVAKVARAMRITPRSHPATPRGKRQESSL